MRAWRYAEQSGYQMDRCQRLGINAQAARQVGPLFEQFLRIAADEGLDIGERTLDRAAVQRCLLVAFPDHLGKRLDAGSQRCDLVHGRRGTLARESVVKAPLFVVAEVREVESGGGRERNLNVVLNLATAVKEEWLREMFPQGFTETRAIVYDPALRRVVAREEKRFRDLLLEEKISDQSTRRRSRGDSRARSRSPVVWPWKTGTSPSNNGSCASIACANGCRSWSCPPSPKRTGR